MRSDKVPSIFEAAVTLFGERPPEVVTMEEIAARAGVAKGTLYNYFDSKEELVRSLVAARMDELLDGLAASAGEADDWDETLRRMIEHVFRFQVESPHWFRLRRRVEGDAGTREILREREGRVRAAFRSVLDAARLPDCRPGCDAALILGAIDAAVARCLENGGDATGGSDDLWRFVRQALAGAAPLARRTVLVTREESERGALSTALAARGARVVHVPVLETLPPEDAGPLREAAENLAAYDWIFLTSARGARSLWSVLPPGHAPERIAAVGEATARAVREEGFTPAVVGRAGAAALVEEMKRHSGGLAGARVLFPGADRVRPEGIAALRDARADVTMVTAYRIAIRSGAATEVARMLSVEAIDAIAFASPSAVEALADGNGFSTDVCAAALGPSSAAALEAAGFRDVVVADRPDFTALADALSRRFARRD